MNSPSPQHEIETPPIPVTEHVALAVLTSEVRHIKEAVDRIESAASHNLPRSSWEQRNTYVDEKFLQVANMIADAKTNLSKDIKDLETSSNKAIQELWTEIRSKRIPWTSIAAFFVAGLLGLFEIIERFGVK